VIFFSGSSSSAKFFWYFSQFWPVALGMMQVLTAQGWGARVKARVRYSKKRNCLDRKEDWALWDLQELKSDGQTGKTRMDELVM
jgi:hypothetical protein